MVVIAKSVGETNGVLSLLLVIPRLASLLFRSADTNPPLPSDASVNVLPLIASFWSIVNRKESEISPTILNVGCCFNVPLYFPIPITTTVAAPGYMLLLQSTL